MKVKLLLFVTLSLFSFSTGFSQVGIGTTAPNSSSILELKSANSGLLIPRISLTSSSDIATIPNPAISLLIYNTSSTSDVIPGFYYWDGAWKTITKTSNSTTGAWNLTGNTTTGTEYLGTNNFNSLDFKVNNGDFAKFFPNGGINIGIGSAANVNNSIAIGTSAQALTNNEAIALGQSSNASGYQSIALGYNAVASNNTSAAFGHSSNASGYRSASVGFSSRSTNNNAIAVGNGSNSTGEQSLSLGYESAASGQNSTAIGYQATTAQANAIVLGSTSNTNNKVGIGTNTPDERLHVVGSVKIVDGVQANGYVLTSDANGKGTWKNPNDSKAYGEIYKTTSSGLASGQITLNTGGISQNVTIGTNSIQVTKTGTYKVSYTISIRKTSGGSINPEFYLGISGAEITGTRTFATIGNGDTRSVTLTKLCALTASQAVSIYSSLSDGSTNVLANGTTLLVELVN
ncbi:hypothetical protein [Flavobacterium sp.]|uniref:hypothetical protein n=1 Tax=Flavobacterium sp. TaxID=239 RepID=UPI00260D9915|nr:hypothetical protein [Flavobacterium sp.]